MVCAHLLLLGFKAFIAGEGMHYDVVVDLDGTLIRIQVKGTLRPMPRPGRPKSPPSYGFQVARGRRPNKPGDRPRIRPYDARLVDMVSCVALDGAGIAFVPVNDTCPFALHFYDSSTPIFERNGAIGRRRFADFSFSAALEALRRIERGPK
jgi:hypothetical protein